MIKDLRLVEIELFSYCNRKCGWCPNKSIDRHSENIEMSDEVLFGVLLSLKSHEYKGAITFSRYNEPMSHIDIFKERLKQIKKFLPDNKLITNTNGDFITKENLEGLLVDELTIMDYDKLGLGGCLNKLSDAGVVVSEVKYPYIYGRFENIEILYFVDWTDNRNITDRGGFLKEYSFKKRTSVCHEPKYFVGINYDGTVSPCCNVRNDVEAHKPFIIGNINEESLSSILEDKSTILFVENCENGKFEENSPCYFCANSGGRYTTGRNGIHYE